MTNNSTTHRAVLAALHTVAAEAGDTEPDPPADGIMSGPYHPDRNTVCPATGDVVTVGTEGTGEADRLGGSAHRLPRDVHRDQ